MNGWIFLVLSLACSDKPDRPRIWTDTRAVSGIMGQLDKNGDGEIQASEYAPTAFATPGFSSLDQDGSGGLNSAEVLAGLQGQDPLRFDQRTARPPVSVERWRSAQSRSGEVRLRWEHLRFLAIEVQTRHPGTPVPDPAATEALAEQGGDPYAKAVSSLMDTLKQP